MCNKRQGFYGNAETTENCKKCDACNCAEDHPSQTLKGAERKEPDAPAWPYARWDTAERVDGLSID